MHEKALSIQLDALKDSHPDSLEIQEDIAYNYSSMGDNLRQLGKYDEAIEAYNRFSWRH